MSMPPTRALQRTPRIRTKPCLRRAQRHHCVPGPGPPLASGQLVRFVAVSHPSRGSCLLMCTDVSLEAIEIIRLYGLRFKIEYGFKQAVRQIGSFRLAS